MYTKVCEVCGESLSVVRCPICNRYVCEKHFNAYNKRCAVCEESICDICNDALSISRCNICGRKVCHKCSIEIDEVRRICFYCIISLRYKSNYRFYHVK
uniref:Kazal-like domain-containing protein n=1 Tax=Ignisphaera aggregans TaxID=334771 RepID=A0A7J3QG37_9CREN